MRRMEKYRFKLLMTLLLVEQIFISEAALTTFSTNVVVRGSNQLSLAKTRWDRLYKPTITNYRKSRVCSSQATKLKMCTHSECSHWDEAARAGCTLSYISKGEVAINACSCLGFCGDGPNFKRKIPPKIFRGVRNVKDAVRLLEQIENPSIFRQDDFRARVEVATGQDKGWHAIRTMRPEEAIQHFSEALNKASIVKAATNIDREIETEMKSRLLSARAEAHLQAGSIKMGLEDANAAVDRHPGNAHAWKIKADAHDHLGEQEKAQMAKSIVTRINPTYFW